MFILENFPEISGLLFNNSESYYVSIKQIVYTIFLP